MNLRNFKLIQYPALIFLTLCMFNTIGRVSSAQDKKDRGTSHQRAGKSAKGNLSERFNQLIQEMKHKGHDVSEAEALRKKARHAAKGGNRQEARQLLEQAISKLESLESEDYPAPKLSGNIETSKTVQIELPVKSKVRVIETFPRDTNTISGNVLQNFHYSEQESKDGVILLSINSPVIVQEYPYSDFKFQNNKAFGSTESGQSNKALRGLPDNELNSRQGIIFHLLSQSGLGVARDFKSYDTRRENIEHKKGVYNFSRSDYAVSTALSVGIDFIGRLNPHRDREKGGFPDDESAYVTYIKQTVGHYKGRIKYWQTLKEPEPRMRNRIASGNDGGLSPEDAVRILKLSYTTIKSVDSNALVYFPGIGPPFEFGSYNEDSYLENIIALGGAKYFDVIGFDAYAYDIEEQAVEYRNTLKKYGYDRPLWIAQTGVPDVEPAPKRKWIGGGSPMAQCSYMVKTYATAFAIGLEKVFWGEFLDESLRTKTKDDSRKRDGKAIAQRQGLFSTGSWERKPGYFTHRLLASVLYDFDKAERVAPNIVKFTFVNRSDIYIVWPK